MKMPKMVFVGHVCIDRNKTERGRYTSWGSGVLYMASYAQNHLDIRPNILTRYGDDFAEYAPLFQLHPSRPQHKHTLVYENIIRKGNRVQRCTGVEIAGPPEITKNAAEMLRQADIIVLATLLPNYPATFVRNILSHASSSSLFVCFPQGYFRHVHADGSITRRIFSEAKNVLPLFDLIMFSDHDHQNNLKRLRHWAQFNSERKMNIIVTEGAKGASIATTEGIYNVPTIPIPDSEVVDSVGSGDVFGIAVTYKYYQTGDLVEAIKFGHQAARRKILSASISQDKV